MDLVGFLAEVLLIYAPEKVLVVRIQNVPVLEMVLNDKLVKTVELLNSIFSNSETVLIKDRLIFIVDHLSLNILRKREVRFSLCEDVHLLCDDLDVVDVP